MMSETRAQTVDFIRDLENKKYKLRSQKSDFETKNEGLNQLSAYFEGTTDEVGDLKTLLENQLKEAQQILHLLQKYQIVDRETLRLKLATSRPATTIDTEIAEIELQIKRSYIVFDICERCKGNKTVYDSEAASGDPYARSRDYQMTCTTCRGTGKYAGSIVI
jgi:DNA repair exonuclease SbcCD ATPase subunit